MASQEVLSLFHILSRCSSRWYSVWRMKTCFSYEAKPTSKQGRWVSVRNEESLGSPLFLRLVFSISRILLNPVDHEANNVLTLFVSHALSLSLTDERVRGAMSVSLTRRVSNQMSVHHSPDLSLLYSLSCFEDSPHFLHYLVILHFSYYFNLAS